MPVVKSGDIQNLDSSNIDNSTNIQHEHPPDIDIFEFEETHQPGVENNLIDFQSSS